MPIPFRAGWTALLLFGVCSSVMAVQDDEAADSLAPYYGFSGLEIFKLERRSGNMQKGDFNADGLLDLVLVDNSHSRLDLLVQRKQGEEDKPGRVNEITNDWRFRHQKVPVDRQVAALSVGDLNNDGRTDIAYLGLPDRLIVRYQPEAGKSDWSKRFTTRLPNLQPAMWMMAVGDLNHDRLDDVVILGKTATYVLYQTADGRLDTPVSIMNTSTGLGLVQVADLDGDGLDDLSYLATEDNARVLCARLQLAGGGLGAEMRFGLNRPRAVTLFNLDETPATEVLTIDTRTGRVVVSRLKQASSEPGELAARLTHYGFGEQGGGKDRDLATGDVDGDGRLDVVVTDPDQAQMLVFLQEAGRGPSLPAVFPGLLGANQVQIADFDGDQRAEVVVLSPKEKVIAVSRYEDGRLTFPQTLPGAAGVEPVCFVIGDANHDGRPEVVHISNRKEGRSSKPFLGVLTLADGEWQAVEIGGKTEIPIELPATPTRLKSLDANDDGQMDLLVFFELNKPPALLIGSEDGTFTLLQPEGGMQLGKLEPSNVTVAGSDKATQILVSQEGFARRLVLKDGQWQVLDQYNAAEPKAAVSGSVEIDLDGEPGTEIVLVDTGVRKLRVLRRHESIYRPWREVELGSVDFRGAEVGDLNGDGRDDLLLVGKGQFAVLYAGQTDPELEELASYETKLDRVFFQDLTAGDLNADGRPDIAVVDTRSHFIEILNFDPARGLRHALQFRVFEEKSFSADRNAAGSEPREVMIADVTGDGRSDLLLLAHDRVLLYPQDPGPTDADESAAASASLPAGK